MYVSYHILYALYIWTSNDPQLINPVYDDFGKWPYSNKIH